MITFCISWAFTGRVGGGKTGETKTLPRGYEEDLTKSGLITVELTIGKSSDMINTVVWTVNEILK